MTVSARFPDITPDTTTTLIIAPDDASPEWLTPILGTLVRKVEISLRKELQYSTVCRLAIQYDDDAAGQPQSLFLKLTGGTRDLEDIGRTEVEFYTEVAPEMNCPPLVRCYDAAFHDVTKRSHILLDDLFDTHSQPEDGSPPPEQMSRLAVEALAKTHAHWWNSPRLGNGIGTRFDAAALKKFVDNLDDTVTRFLRVAELTSDQTDAYQQMLDAADVIWGRLMRRHDLTVTHGDMHWWNFLYPKDPAEHSVHVIDWHLWHIDLGARDLAFLLALGGFAEPRPELEEDLLRAYHKTLGVRGYSWELLIDDYRWSAIRNLNIPVIFWTQGKHESTWQTALRRAWEAYERLECGDLIGQ